MFLSYISARVLKTPQNKTKKHYLYDDAHIVPHLCGCEAGELRVWIVGYCCGAGQGFIGYFQIHTAFKNHGIFSCRCVISEILQRD